jgi:hypothetical protein
MGYLLAAMNTESSVKALIFYKTKKIKAIDSSFRQRFVVMICQNL